MKLKEKIIYKKPVNGKKFRFSIVVSDFNRKITGDLLKHCFKTLLDAGVLFKNVDVVHAPGAFEIPLLVQKQAKSHRYNGVIALGCVIRGKTPHDRYISQEVTRGLGEVALKTEVPVLYGILTPLNEEQALERSGNGKKNKGREVALAALEMAGLLEGEKAEK